MLMLTGLALVVFSVQFAPLTFPYNLPFSIGGGFMIGRYASKLFKIN
jgi:hypothetical protein